MESWSSGEVYEPFMGRWSRLVAREVVGRLAVPAGGAWLDVGCGTGALTEAVLAGGAPSSVVGVDPSAGFVQYAAAHVTDARASFLVGDAQALPVDDCAVDVVVSGLVLNFVPDQAAALAEVRRVARPGATVAVYVWDYAGEMQLLRYFWDAAAAQDPAARALDEGVRFASCRPGPLRESFLAAGFAPVEVWPVVVPTTFADFDDYWSPLLGGQAPAPAYAMSLGEGDRSALREALRARLPVQGDGSIRLTARAWAVRAVRP